MRDTALCLSRPLGSCLGRFAMDEDGASSIEYGFIAAGIAIAIIVGVNAVGADLDVAFTNMSSLL